VTPANLSKLLFGFVESIEPLLAELNRDQIFEKSVDIFGDPLGYYSRATEFITTNDALLGGSSRIKGEGEPYDFKDKNIFLPSIFAKVSRDFINFGSSDPKLDDILSNVRLLSKSFFGLTQENKFSVIQEQIKPHMLSVAREALGI